MKRTTFALLLVAVLASPVFAGTIEDLGHSVAPPAVDILLNLLSFMF